MQARVCKGVTLVEFFIVLGILVVLVSLLLPSVLSARERAREVVCKNNIHQIQIGLAHYTKVHKKLPPPSTPGIASGWAIEVLPFLELGALADTIPAGVSLDDIPVSLKVPPVIFRCPSRTTIDSLDEAHVWPGHYVVAAGSRRDSFVLFDAPLSMSSPWLASKESVFQVTQREKGPHGGGFFYSQGDGVSSTLGRD